MKNFSLSFILPIVMIFLFAYLMQYVLDMPENSKSEKNGVLILNSQMAGLKITIDEESVGLSEQNITQKFLLEKDGTAKSGSHEVSLQKDINKTHEWYLHDRFSFSKYVDVKEYPKEYLNIFITKPEQKTYPPINFQIHKRIKPDVLAHKTGLITKIKLQHNSSWHMHCDSKNIYVISTASEKLWSKKMREKESGEFLEIYDIKSYKLKEVVKLGEESSPFNYFQGLTSDENFIYIGTLSAYTIFYDNLNSKNYRVKKRGILNGSDIKFKSGESLSNGYDRHEKVVSNVKIYGKNLFTISEDGKVGVYEKLSDNKYHFRAMLDTKRHYPPNYFKLKDRRFGNIFDLVVHKNILYISSDIGVIFKFDLSSQTPKFAGVIDTIYYDDEYKCYIGHDISSMQIYKERYLLFSNWYNGLSMYDTQKNEMVFAKKNLYPKERSYSELFKKEFDTTKTTDIYKFLIYKDTIIFTELKPQVVVYSLSKKRITHKFLGIEYDVSDIGIDEDRLFALSANEVYVYDLKSIR